MSLDKDNIIVGSARITIDGVESGYTQGGVSLRSQNDMLDVDADQVAGIIRKEVTMERLYAATTLIEGTLENIRLAMNNPSGNAWSGSALALGSAIPSAVEHEVILSGKAPHGGSRTITLTRCISIEEVEMPMQRDAVFQIPVTFECLKDPDKGDHFGTIVDTPAEG